VHAIASNTMQFTRIGSIVALAAIALHPTGCKRSTPPADVATTEPLSATYTPPTPEPPAEPVQTVEIPVAGDLPAFLVRGASEHRRTMLFLPGMCAHPAGYVASFEHAAAERGDLIGVQGDSSCGGDGSLRRWSYDLDAMNRRIEAASEAAGLGEPSDVIVIGYSQGAQRAEQLVARFPDRYSRAILIASPVTPAVANLARAEAVVFMAGNYDMALDRMRTAARSLERASVPSTFILLPNARHGQMGDTPEETMRDALDFVETGLRS
jgi:pimeloyl-ACP methyl ester carboxylesterase